MPAEHITPANIRNGYVCGLLNGGMSLDLIAGLMGTKSSCPERIAREIKNGRVKYV